MREICFRLGDIVQVCRVKLLHESVLKGEPWYLEGISLTGTDALLAKETAYTKKLLDLMNCLMS